MSNDADPHTDPHAGPGTTRTIRGSGFVVTDSSRDGVRTVTIRPVDRSRILALAGMMPGIFLIVLGSIFAVVGWKALSLTSPPDGGVTTDALIIGYDRGQVLINNRVHPSFAPVYEYHDADGRLHRVTDRIAAGSFPPVVGATVEISYLPDDPGSVRRTDIGYGWLRWFVIGGGAGVVLGVIILLVTAFTAFRHTRRRRAERRPASTFP